MRRNETTKRFNITSSQIHIHAFTVRASIAHTWTVQIHNMYWLPLRQRRYSCGDTMHVRVVRQQGSKISNIILTQKREKDRVTWSWWWLVLDAMLCLHELSSSHLQPTRTTNMNSDVKKKNHIDIYPKNIREKQALNVFSRIPPLKTEKICIFRLRLFHRPNIFIPIKSN